MMTFDTVKVIIALIITVALACAGFFGCQEWREIQRERHAVAEAAVSREAKAVAEVRDSLVDARAQLDAALAAGRSVIAARTTVVPIVRARPRPPIMAVEHLHVADVGLLRGIVAAQGRALDSLGARGDSVETALVIVRDTLARVIVAADRYRLYAEATIGAQARQIGAMRVVIETPKPRRRWGVGGAGGYCAVNASGDGDAGVRQGAGVCVGLSFNF